jgi:hypothetical protein
MHCNLNTTVVFTVVFWISSHVQVATVTNEFGGSLLGEEVDCCLLGCDTLRLTYGLRNFGNNLQATRCHHLEKTTIKNS